MHLGFGKVENSKGKSLAVTAHLKRSTVEVKAKENCLAQALVIAVAKLTNYPNYQVYRKGGRSCPRFASCCRCRVLISVDEEGSPNYGSFNVIYHSRE